MYSSTETPSIDFTVTPANKASARGKLNISAFGVPDLFCVGVLKILKKLVHPCFSTRVFSCFYSVVLRAYTSLLINAAFEIQIACFFSSP